MSNPSNPAEHPDQTMSTLVQDVLTAASNVQHATTAMREAGQALATTAGHISQLNKMIQDNHNA